MPKFRRKNMDAIAVKLDRKARLEALEKQNEGEDKLTQEELLLCMVDHKDNVGFFVETAHGPSSITPGGWIVKRGKNDIVPMGDQAFKELYEEYSEEELKEPEEPDENPKEPETTEEPKVTGKYCD